MIRRRPTICSRRSSRRGAAIVEAAVVLGVFLMILLGSLDLALAVLRDNTLAEGARRLARAAIVRGEASSNVHPPWGPTAYAGTADEATEFAAAIRDILVVIDPAEVSIEIDWPDGTNASGDRVEVVLASEYQPILPSLFGSDPYVLRATSTMRIEH